jgi:cytochrome P450
MNDLANANKALSGYEPHVLEHCQSFLDLVLYQRGTALEVTNLLSRFTWDSMGILVSGRSFNMLHGTPHEVLDQVRKYAPIARLLLWAPWVMILTRNLPILERQTASLMEWYTQYIEERKKVRKADQEVFIARN